METQTQFPTKPLLKPDQVQSTKDEISSLEAKLTNPLIQDKGEVRKQLVRTKAAFEEQAPKPPKDGDEAGAMERRSRELLDRILVGMPSQEEMRKAPPGAVEKHRAWEKRNKPLIGEWKHIQRRLNAGSEDGDSNLEKYRPTSSSLNMDNALIPGQRIFMPHTLGASVIFNDEQIQLLRSVSPPLADALASMSNQQRQQVKDAISGIGLAPSAASVAGKKGAAKKRVMSEKQKAAMKAGRDKKAAEKAEKVS